MRAGLPTGASAGGWSTPIDLYCERTDPTFWSEPVNAISNVAFLIAAVAAFVAWRKSRDRDPAVLALIGVVVLVGVGSFIFHTVATRGTMLLDVGPIGIFIYGYLLLALRRFLHLSWGLSIALLLSFIAFSTAVDSLVPRTFINGSAGYLPAWAALLIIGALTRTEAWGRALLSAAAVFTFSIGLRTIDLDICKAVPLGTHFLWHMCNAIVLYLVLGGALEERRSKTS